MAGRKIPDIPVYKGQDKHVASIFDKLKQAVDHIINTDFVTEKDIYCNDLRTASSSIYIGEKSPRNKLEIVNGELKFAQNRVTTDNDTRKIIDKQAKDIERLEVKIADLEKKLKDKEVNNV